MYKTSPAFSIKGKYNQTNREIKPSPFAYNVENINMKKTPAWKIGTDHKCKITPNPNPGPGQYQQSYNVQRCNKFGIIGKQNGRAIIEGINKSPSPNTYSPVLKDNGPAISFAKKYQIINKDINNPGPGAYDKQFSLKSLQNTCGSIIGKQKRFQQEKQQKLKPGPGTYSASQFKRPSSAIISFTKQVRQCGKQLNTSVNPGPGQYYNQSQNLFSQSVKSCKGFSIKGKYTTKDPNIYIPGPTNYNPDFSKVTPSNPSFSMTKKYKQNKPAECPGPTAYNPKQIYQQLHITFNRAERKPFLNNKDIPGPGQYQSQSTQKLNKFKSSPKFSLGMSRKTDIKQDFPGPGQYQPNKNAVKLRPQSAKIGKSKKFTDYKQNSPGPGEYEFYKKSRPTTPCYVFGKDSRLKNNINIGPGPGQYEIMPLVGYTAPYALK